VNRAVTTALADAMTNAATVAIGAKSVILSGTTR